MVDNQVDYDKCVKLGAHNHVLESKVCCKQDVLFHMEQVDILQLLHTHNKVLQNLQIKTKFKSSRLFVHHKPIFQSI